ncbi:YceI family protein [Candidatus Poribacteria bacterium]|nr:YceI family protein [Candidatus Poribacteria bacterium]
MIRTRDGPFRAVRRSELPSVFHLRLLPYVVAVFSVAASAWAAPMAFHVNEDKRDEVTFTSDAPVEKIIGKASRTRGTAIIQNLADIARGKVVAKFEVDLDSIDTGNGLRNRHMREQYLETAKFPRASLTLEKIERVQTITQTPTGKVARDVSGLQPGVATRVTAVGTFEIHGVKRTIRLIDLDITYLPESEKTKTVRPGSLLRIVGSFGMRLSDYDIRRPQLMLLRVSDEVTVAFDVTAGTEVPIAKPLITCDDCDDSK